MRLMSGQNKNILTFWRFDVLGTGDWDHRFSVLKLRRAVLICMVNPRRYRPFRHKGGGGGYDTPLAVSPLIELELRGKKRACSSPRDEEIDI